MESTNGESPAYALAQPHDSLFERLSWFYALCREYLFRDHTEEIAHSLFPPGGPPAETRLLELGCGPGFYACRLSEQYPTLRTTGVDLSFSLIQRAKDRAAARQLSNCSFQHADAHSLPYPSSSVDCIVVSRLFLIVPDKEGIVREIFRVLKPSGVCFIAEPTSGFRTRLPLALMWLLARLTTSPAGKYREPQQADVLSRPDFAALIHTQPWAEADLQYDGWYQYAVCRRGTASTADVPLTRAFGSEALDALTGSSPSPFTPPQHRPPVTPAFS
jgi:ubiquinone/menaquinone biosynthesis C-methylase UbiE